MNLLIPPTQAFLPALYIKSKIDSLKENWRTVAVGSIAVVAMAAIAAVALNPGGLNEQSTEDAIVAAAEEPATFTP